MSKQPEAQFDIKTGAMMINDSINELLSQDEDTGPENVDEDIIDTEEEDDTPKTSKSRKVSEFTSSNDDEDEEDDEEESEDNEDEDEDEEDSKPLTRKKSSKSKKENDDDEEDDEDYSDYSDISLLALALKEEEPDLIDFDIKKNMNPKQLVNGLKNSIGKIANEQLQYLEDKYADAAQYINYLIQNGDPEVVRQGMKLKEIADIDLDSDDIEESDLEEIVDAGLIQKGIVDPEEREALIETFKDKGKLFDKAQDTVNTFQQIEKNYIENALAHQRAEKERQQREYVQFRKKMEDTINKGIVKGLPIKDKKKLYNAIFTPTETVTRYTDDGRKVTVKDTLYRIKFEEYNNDVEQQVAFAQLLIDGFDFTKLVEVAKKSVNEDILKVLDNRSGSKKKNSGDNPWFDL